MIVYLARAIQAFVMYCVNGTSRSSLLIESTDSMIYIYIERERETVRERGRERKHKQSSNISELKMNRNKARQQLRKAVQSSSEPQVICDLANSFHQYLC